MLWGQRGEGHGGGLSLLPGFGAERRRGRPSPQPLAQITGWSPAGGRGQEAAGEQRRVLLGPSLPLQAGKSGGRGHLWAAFSPVLLHSALCLPLGLQKVEGAKTQARPLWRGRELRPAAP